jgi:predicted DsbA family dithiol-disulfide isomerase
MNAAGIEGFTMEGRTGPSSDSHRLLAWAADAHGQAAQHTLAEALFRTYFAEGRPLCERAALLAAVAAAGLPAGEAAALLDDPEKGTAELQQELRLGRELGISGVPYFRITDGAGRAATVSGAQPAEVLANAIRGLLPAERDGAACDAGGCV